MMKYILLMMICLSKLSFAVADDNMAENQENFYKKLDPYEKINRRIFSFNLFLDRALFRPTAAIYETILPRWGKERVSNFTSNLRQPLTLINYTLQKDKENALKSFRRLAVNSIFGIGGMFDVASRHGKNFIVPEQTFNDTAYHYKIKPSAYIMLPLLGPTSVRGVFGAFLDYSLDPVNFVFDDRFIYAEKIVHLIDVRNENREFLEHIEKTSMDPYATIRSFYIQKYGMASKSEKNTPNYDEYYYDEQK